MTAPTNRASDKFMLRFPDGMRDRIAELAKENNRSMNAEIVARLQISLEGGNEEQRVDGILYVLQEALTRMGYKDPEGNPPHFIDDEEAKRREALKKALLG